MEHQEDIQQRHFHSSQPKSTKNKPHWYPTRSKTLVDEAETTPEEKEFVFLIDKGEKATHVFKQFEFILCNKFGEPRLDPERKEIVVIGPSPNDVVSRVFLTKLDERGNMKQSQVVELINKFDDDADRDPLRCKFRIKVEKILLLVKTLILTTSYLTMISLAVFKEKTTMKTANIGNLRRYLATLLSQKRKERMTRLKSKWFGRQMPRLHNVLRFWRKTYLSILLSMQKRTIY